MTRPLRIVPEAAEELEAAIAWYEAQGPGLGEAFLGAVDRAVDAIRANPATYALVALVNERPVRFKRLGRFPFNLVFPGGARGSAGPPRPRAPPPAPRLLEGSPLTLPEFTGSGTSPRGRRRR
jgi:hypothetical protein